MKKETLAREDNRGNKKDIKIKNNQMSNYFLNKERFLNKETLIPITNGIPWVGCRVYKGMGRGIADASMADYPT